MARLFGVVLDDRKRIEYSLTKIYGIGWTRSSNILSQLGIDPHVKTGDITEDQLKMINSVIEKNFKVEGLLREQINEDFKRIRDISSYRAVRHAQGLPSRGQRTRSNARTKRGKRQTVGALRKEVWAKLEQQQKTVKK